MPEILFGHTKSEGHMSYLVRVKEKNPIEGYAGSYLIEAIDNDPYIKESVEALQKIHKKHFGKDLDITNLALELIKISPESKSILG